MMEEFEGIPIASGGGLMLGLLGDCIGIGVTETLGAAPKEIRGISATSARALAKLLVDLADEADRRTVLIGSALYKATVG